jgi:hypothetical protein
MEPAVGVGCSFVVLQYSEDHVVSSYFQMMVCNWEFGPIPAVMRLVHSMVSFNLK